ncbi:short chain dehydrogenase/reductase family oxidoreductase, partial [Pseudomonas syringae pv. actinidiae ICMP 18804]
MYQRFSGKTVVITGACRGIGAGIAERFAQEGANLVLASNDLERVTFTSEQLASEYSVNSLALGID